MLCVSCDVTASALTISRHSKSKTLLQAAVLAAVAVCPVDETVPLAGTRVGRIVLLAPSEETLKMPRREREYRRRGKRSPSRRHERQRHLASLTGDDSVVDA